jgi:hypothetical protein
VERNNWCTLKRNDWKVGGKPGMCDVKEVKGVYFKV